MFVDHATIFVQAGNGGQGCAAFRREKYVPKGGPDGGNGGKGGSVIAIADPNVSTLLDLRYHRHWKASKGIQGSGKCMTGRDGEDAVIKLPAGTTITDADSGELIADLEEGDRIVVAKGGEGGLGNAHFKSATNQTPDTATPGEPGEERTLRLELKLIADVGIIGKPNAGKSTLLTAITAATPKVADYPFTTLSPQLGITELDHERRIVFADIPGLIEGAAEGAGLGHDFLRHVERTRVLLHLVELEPTDGSSFADNYRAIRKELFDYAPALAEKPEMLAITKLDLLGTNPEEDAQMAEQMVRTELQLGHDTPVFIISSAGRLNLRPLLEACWELLDKKPEGFVKAPLERGRTEAASQSSHDSSQL